MLVLKRKALKTIVGTRYMPITPVLRRRRQDDRHVFSEFPASLGSGGRDIVSQTPNQNQIRATKGYWGHGHPSESSVAGDQP